MKKYRYLLLCFLLVFPLAVFSCGGEDDSSSPPDDLPSDEIYWRLHEVGVYVNVLSTDFYPIEDAEVWFEWTADANCYSVSGSSGVNYTDEYGEGQVWDLEYAREDCWPSRAEVTIFASASGFNAESVHRTTDYFDSVWVGMEFYRQATGEATVYLSPY